MQADEFVRRVQVQAKIATGDAALKVIEASLETLGERIRRDVRQDLAAQLPDQLKAYLNKRQETTRFDLEEFYNRVAGRSDLGLPAAVLQSQAVIDVLQQAVSPGQLQDIRRQLPAEYEELFSGEPYGPNSPAASVEGSA
jgi:uncharacterized protein (DUF2267 family)